jgi:hypothetical protein
MKKIILEENESKIHLSKITKNDIIVAKLNGKFCATITYNGGEWICVKSQMISKPFNKLSNAIDFFDNDYEFYVLD